MKFTVSDKTFIVGWRHETSEKDGSRSTICTIEQVHPDGKREALCGGTAFCSNKDIYSRNKGRKLSLQRALASEVPPAEGNSGEWVRVFSIEDRRVAWNEYHTMRGKW